jgi:hypothetical protein
VSRAERRKGGRAERKVWGATTEEKRSIKFYHFLLEKESQVAQNCLTDPMSSFCVRKSKKKKV